MQTALPSTTEFMETLQVVQHKNKSYRCTVTLKPSCKKSTNISAMDSIFVLMSYSYSHTLDISSIYINTGITYKGFILYHITIKQF